MASLIAGLMMALVAVAGFFGVIVALAALRGYVLVSYWMWFIVPTFGAKPLSIPVAIGISALISMVTHQRTAKDDSEWYTILWMGLWMTGFFWLYGWVVHSYFM